MAKRVVIIASGPTEREALPHLLKYLDREGIALDIRIPPGHRKLRSNVLCGIIYAAQHDSLDGPPAKYVILVDTDGKSPEEALIPIQQGLQRTSVVEAVGVIKYTYAQWHLEAWYFADARNLRNYLGRDVGNIDPNQPDAIQNPKLHLRRLLGDRMYTAELSGDIAKRLDPQTIAQRSPSFRGFVEAVRNGAPQ